MGKRSGLFGYYNFIEKYRREPFDLDDFSDGLQVMHVNNLIVDYLHKKEAKKKG
jgi:hypothetical protein